MPSTVTLLRVSVVLLFVVSQSCLAEMAVKFSGFGTLGVVHADSEQYGFRTNVGSNHATYADELDWQMDSLLGLQLEVDLLPQLDLVLQGVLRDRTEDTLEQALELAFVRYAPAPAWSLRVGRTALDLFQLTEYRNIAYSYLWVRPPVEFYGSIAFRHLDGADLSYVHHIGRGLLRGKVFAGRSEAPITAPDDSTQLKVDVNYGLVLEYEYADWRFRFNHTQVEVNTAPSSNNQLHVALEKLKKGIDEALSLIPPGTLPVAVDQQALVAEVADLDESFSIVGKLVNYTAVGVSFDQGTWLIQSELGQVDSNSRGIPTLRTGYLSVARRIHTHTPYLAFSLSHADRVMVNTPVLNDLLPQLEQFGQSIQQTQLVELAQGGYAILDGIAESRNFYVARQKNLALGWRWEVTDYAALKLQWDHTWLDEQADTFWLRNTSERPEASINIVSVTLSGVF